MAMRNFVACLMKEEEEPDVGLQPLKDPSVHLKAYGVISVTDVPKERTDEFDT